MNSKKNSNAIRRYSNASCNSNSNYVTNPISSEHVNAFRLFTKNLSYFKTKYQHKHFDKANEPYQITFDKSRTNAYIKWGNIHDVSISIAEQKQIEQIILLACDKLFSDGVELSVSNVKDITVTECPNIYFNDVSIASVITQYKKSMRNNEKVISNNRIILRTMNDMFDKGVEISTDSVKKHMPKNFYYGCSIVSELVAHFKQLHKNDRPAWVIKNLSVISKGAKRLGTVVK